MAYRDPNALRPETVLEGLGPRFGEYPVALLTRRTWGLRANEVVNRRESAPTSVWDDARSNPDARESA
ncbi:MAG TPA: hypothetical protein VKU82_09590 [Planctomycetaceae bacterium]|nr:hypothetical protein [Planctomycetaceae bacterium]